MAFYLFNNFSIFIVSPPYKDFSRLTWATCLCLVIFFLVLTSAAHVVFIYHFVFTVSSLKLPSFTFPFTPTPQKAKEYAEEFGLPYFETSAKTGDNVEALFRSLGGRGSLIATWVVSIRLGSLKPLLS